MMTIHRVEDRQKEIQCSLAVLMLKYDFEVGKLVSYGKIVKYIVAKSHIVIMNDL
jgi:hypothetical protein